MNFDDIPAVASGKPQWFDGADYSGDNGEQVPPSQGGASRRTDKHSFAPSRRKQLVSDDVPADEEWPMPPASAAAAGSFDDMPAVARVHRTSDQTRTSTTTNSGRPSSVMSATSSAHAAAMSTLVADMSSLHVDPVASMSASHPFDEVAAVARNAAVAPPDAPEDDAFEGLPVDVLLRHGSWKARKRGFDAIAEQSRLHGCSSEGVALLISDLARGAKEPNAVALEAFIEAVASIVSHLPAADAPNAEALEDSGVLRVMIDKGLPGRLKAVASAEEVIRYCVEDGRGESVFKLLLAGIHGKAPKARTAAAAMLALLLADYGLCWVPVKPLMAAIVNLFTDVDPKIRKEAANMVAHVYSYAGDGVMPFLSGLRDVQLAELQKTFATLPRLAEPPRSIRSGNGAPRSITAAAAAPRSAAKAQPPASAASILLGAQDEVSVGAALPRHFFENVLDKSLKWPDRNALIKDHLLPAVCAARLKVSDDYTEVVKLLRDLVNDPQMPLVASAMTAVGGLAKGLGAAFVPYSRFLLPALFEKFKDKKTSLLEATTSLLLSMMQCCGLTLDHCGEVIEEGLTSKVPHHRLAVMRFLVTVLTQVQPAPFTCSRLCKHSVGTFQRLVNDEKAENREAAVQLLRKLSSLYGSTMDATVKQLDGLADRIAKDAPSDDSAPLHSTAAHPSSSSSSTLLRSSSPPPPLNHHQFGQFGSSAPAAAAARPRELDSRHLRTTTVASRSTASSTTTTNSGSTRSQNPTPVAAAAGSGKTRPTAVGASVGGTDEAAEPGNVPGAEESAAVLDAALGLSGGLGAILNRKDWRERLEGFNSITEKYLSAVTAGSQDASKEPSVGAVLEALVAQSKAHGWKETMFQVVNAWTKAFIAFCERPDVTVSPRLCWVMVHGTAPRLSDAKTVVVVKELFTVLAEHVGLVTLHRQLAEFVTANKLSSPKVAIACAEWIDQSLVEYATAAVDARALAGLAKSYYFENASPAVRSAGTAMIATLRRKVGASKVDALLGDMNPHLKAALEAETSTDGSAPTGEARSQRTVRPANSSGSGAVLASRGVAAAAASILVSGGASEGAAEGAAPFISPRVDISATLGACVRVLTTSRDWKDRAAALKQIDDAVAQSGRHIAAAGVTDAMKVLKMRFEEETNKNLVVDVLKTLNVLADAAGAGGRAGLRVIVASLVSLLGDQKPALRDEAIKLVRTCVLTLGHEVAVSVLPRALTVDSQSARQAAADILDEASQRGLLCPPACTLPKALLPLLGPLVRLAMDKSSDLRGKAETLLVLVVQNCGSLEAFNRCMMDLRPAEQQQLRPMAERIRGAFSQPPPASSFSTPPPPQPSRRSVLLGDGNVIPGGQPAAMVSTATVSTSGDWGAAAPPHAASKGQSAASGNASVLLAGQAVTKPPASPPPPPATSTRMACSSVELAQGILAGSDVFAHRLCDEYLLRLQETASNPSASGDVRAMRALLERLLNTCSHDLTGPLNLPMVEHLLHCLHTTFEVRSIMQQLDSATLFNFVGTILELLLSTRAVEETVTVKSINALALRLIDHADDSVMLEALIDRLEQHASAYLNNPSNLNLKYVELVARCILRMTGTKALPMDTVVIKAHNFFHTFPPSAFRDRDDIAIRTIKTLLSSTAKRCGEAFRVRCAELVGTSTLVHSFVQLCLSQLAAQQSQSFATAPPPSHTSTPSASPLTPVSANVVAPVTQRSGSTAHSAPSSSHSSAPASYNPTSSSAGPTSLVAAIFDRVRSHSTSELGLRELYEYCKLHPGCPDYQACYQKCSDPFRGYIDRHLERLRVKEQSGPGP